MKPFLARWRAYRHIAMLIALLGVIVLVMWQDFARGAPADGWVWALPMLAGSVYLLQRNRRLTQHCTLYREAFASAPTAQFLFRDDGVVVAANGSLGALLATTPEALTGQPLASCLPPAWQTHLERRALGTPRIWQDRIAWPAANDTTQHLLLQTERIGEAAAPAQWLTHVIACPTPAPEALPDEQAPLQQRTRAFVQNLIDVIPQPVFLRDTHERYVLVNRAFANLVGKDQAAITEQTLQQVVSEVDLRAEITADDREVIAGRQVLKEIVLRDRHGQDKQHMLLAKGACHNTSGELLIVGALFDVTRWRLAEHDLHAALVREVERRQRFQQYLQRLIDVIPHPVYVKDARSRYVLVNNAHAKDFGVSKERLVGQPSVSNPQSPTGRETLQEDQQVLAGAVVLKEEFKLHKQSGEERYRVIAKGSCLDAEGEPVIVCAVFDVTEWRRAEARWMLAKEAADKANDSKSQFLANMSHELRTPMHAILSFARLGSARTEGQAERGKEHNYFERIVASGERLLRLLNALLDLSKLEAGYALGELRNFDLIPRINEVLAELSALLESNGLKANVRCKGAGLAKGDPDLIEQVVRNLLSNAIKFSPKGGVIEIFVTDHAWLPGENYEDECPALEMRVADQGPGIPEDELDAVFDKFIQSSKTHNGAGGTGLGLSICREVVQAHQGQIFARNLAQGGAEFVVRIPAAQPDTS